MCAPGWRNGIRRGLKILRPQGRVGSTPTPGTSIHTTYWRNVFVSRFCVRHFCHTLVILSVDVLREQLCGIVKVFARRDVVTLKNAFRFVAANAHRHAARDASANEVAHASAPEIVRNKPRVLQPRLLVGLFNWNEAADSSFDARRAPRLIQAPNRLS